VTRSLVSRAPQALTVACLLAFAGFHLRQRAEGTHGVVPPAVTTQVETPAAPESTGTTLFRRVALGVRALLPFAPQDTVPTAMPAHSETVLETHVKGGDGDLPPRLAPTESRRGVPFRTVEEVLPRGIQVMRIPVPASLPLREQVDWTMRAEPTVYLLSATEGSISGAALTDSRAATVVVRVPASAMPGILPVGEATFTTASESITVPLELVVGRVRRATVTSLRPSFAATSGSSTILAFEVMNNGNGVDTFTVRVETLPGWRAGAIPDMILRPAERRRVDVPLHIPLEAGTTAAYPTVRVYSGDADIAATALMLNVTSGEGHDLLPGPDLAVAAASVIGDSTGTMPVFAAQLRGPLGNGIMLNGRAAIATDPSDVNNLGLSRAGIFLGGAFLSATAPGWSATVGNTGSTVSDLVGTGVYGIGGAGSFSRGDIRTSALLVNSQVGSALSAAGKVEKQLAGATVGVAASHLEDGFLVGRTLNAIGLQGSGTPWGGVKLNGEVAWRSFTGGEGLGLYGSAQRATERDFLAISAGYAPGGSSAYARATNELNVSGSRRISERVALRADGFYSIDQPSGGGEFASKGVSLAPAFALGRAMTLETEVRRNDYDAKNEGRGFGNGETQLNGTLRGIRGRTRWTVGGTYATGDRTSDDSLIGLHSVQDYRRLGVSGAMGWTLPRLTLDVGGDFTRSEVASGFFPRQLRVGVSASRIQPFRDPRLPTLMASLDYTTWFSSEQNASIVARIGGEALLARDLALMVDVERNPLIRPAGTPTPWIAAIRLSKSMRLGWAYAEPKTRGMVYQDVNGNGRRDGDEGGLQGVLVRRGSATAVTDAAGRYVFKGRDGDAPTIDPVSLPIGQVVGADSGAKVTGSELAVIPTSPLTIKLVPVADSLGRLPTASPDQFFVIARDQQGNDWAIRPGLDSIARFDALPPGTYTVGADFSGSIERLRVSGEPPVIEVKAGVTLPVIELKYQPRPVRLFTGVPGSTTPRR
jgi:hypothetical protein